MMMMSQGDSWIIEVTVENGESQVSLQLKNDVVTQPKPEVKVLRM